ncbi:DNA polymerase III subunit beta [Ligilactobacillus equi]|nr:DNA polymerase III subunit beta [Ligilactobacillus equi]
MEIKIETKTFKKLMKDMGIAIGSKPTISTLESVKIVATEENIIFTTSDIDLTLVKTVLTGDKVFVNEPGSILMPFRLSSNIINKLSGKTITVQTKSDTEAHIKSGKSKFKISVLSADMFPTIPETNADDKSLTFATDDFATVIKKVSHAASTQESRPTLTGLHFSTSQVTNGDQEENVLSVEATDTHVMAKVTTDINTDGIEWDAIIPAKPLTKISSILEENNEVEIQFTPNQGQITFNLGQNRILLRLIEGNYPDTSRIIPPISDDCTIKLKRKDVLDTFGRATIIAKTAKSLVSLLEIKDDKLTVSSNSPSTGDMHEELSFEPVSSTVKELKIGMNPHYIIQTVSQITSDNVILSFNNSLRPFRVVNPEDDNYIQIITPIRLA